MVNMARTRSRTYSTPTWQKGVAILLAVVLTLMAWDANTLTYAFAADQPAADPATGQTDGKGDPTDGSDALAAAGAEDDEAGEPADDTSGSDEPAANPQDEAAAPGEDPVTPTEPAVETAPVKTYKITWVNEDGTVLEVDEAVEAGTMPTYDGVAPTKEESADYTYEFAGWSPVIANATNDKVYHAVYTATAKPVAADPSLGTSAKILVTNVLKAAGTTANATTVTYVIQKGNTSTNTKFINGVGGKNKTVGNSVAGVTYTFLNYCVLSTGSLVVSEDGTVDGFQTIQKISNPVGDGTMKVFFNDGTSIVVDSNVVAISPIYKAVYSWVLNHNYIDNVSTGSGSASNTGLVSAYSHKFKQPDGQPHYQFLYWQQEGTGETFGEGDVFTFTATASAAAEQYVVNTYAVWQPSVTVNYHDWDGASLGSVEQFDDIDVYGAVADPEIEGATFLGWYDAEGNLLSADATYEKPALTAQELTDPAEHDVYARYSTSYEVQHAVQSLNDEGAYEVVDQSTVNDVVLGSTVSAAPNTYEGFTFDPSAEGTLTETAIAAPGTVLKLFYARNSHTVTYAYEGDVPENAAEAPAEATYKYGATVAVEPDVTVEGYTFSGWSVKGTFEMPDEDVVITGSFAKNPAPAAPAGGTVAPDPTDPTEPTEPETPVTPTEPTTPAEPAAATTVAAAAAAPAATAPAAAPVVFAPAPAPAAVDEPVVVDEPTATPIADDDTPMAQTIADDDTPLDSGAIGSWALINLISTIATVIIGLVLIVRMVGRKRDEDEEREGYGEYAEENEEVAKRHRLLKGIAFLAAPISIVAFLLTEDMTLPMAMVDQWTILMLVILLAQVILAVASRKTDKDTDDDQTQQAAPMTA